jgi:hypothetical protein
LISLSLSFFLISVLFLFFFKNWFV